MKRRTFVIVETEINMLNRSITAEKTEEFAPADLQDLLDCTDSFVNRHIGPTETEIEKMLAVLGVATVEELIAKTVPSGIRLQKSLNLPPALSEYAALAQLKAIAAKNQVFRSFIGMGYHDCITPPVILRNILENPGWYTAYTPYQAEISQGRMEALLNYQTMVCDLTGMEIANASLLDEGTAAAEAMHMFFASRSKEQVQSGANKFWVSAECYPQTIDVLKTRSAPVGIELVIGDEAHSSINSSFFGALLQYPEASGKVTNHSAFVKAAHELGCRVAVAADIMSLVLLTPPGEWGADVVVGNTQRFGVPMGYGGPHAAYFATKEEFKRAFLELKIPDDDLRRAEKNIQLAEMKTIQEQVAYDGSINYQYQLQQQQSKLYSAGQYPKNNLFNPIAWAAFIKAWKDGTLKKQEEPKLDR